MSDNTKKNSKDQASDQPHVRVNIARLKGRATGLHHLGYEERKTQCFEIYRMLPYDNKARMEFLAKYSKINISTIYRWAKDGGWKESIQGTITDKHENIITALTKVIVPNPEDISIGSVIGLMKMYVSLSTSINIDTITYAYQMMSFYSAQLQSLLRTHEFNPNRFSAATRKKFNHYETQLFRYLEKVAFLIDPSKIAKFAQALGLQGAKGSFGDVDSTAYTPKYLQEQVRKLKLNKKVDYDGMIVEAHGEIAVPDVSGYAAGV